METSYQRFLQMGFHVAPAGDQDNHHENWGTANATRTAVLAPTLSRPALLAALRARHTYASEDTNLELRFRPGAAWMGDILPVAPGLLPVTVRIEDPDEPTAQYRVDAFQGVIGGAFAQEAGTWNLIGNGSFPLGGPTTLHLDEPDSYLYFRVSQTSAAGTDRAWTAPIWVAGPAGSTSETTPSALPR